MKMILKLTRLRIAILFIRSGGIVAGILSSTMTPGLPQAYMAFGQTGGVPTAGLATNPVKVETEIVEINNLAGFPSAITRKHGRFALHLVNRTVNYTHNLVVDTPTGTQAGVAALIQGLDLGNFSKRRRSSGLIDLPVGQYRVKSQALGKILLTITIE